MHSRIPKIPSPPHFLQSASHFVRKTSRVAKPLVSNKVLRVSPSLKKPPQIVDMSTSGHLKFQGTNRATFVGTTSNIMFDTTSTSLGIGVTGTDHPSSNLYVTGNAYVSSNIAVGGVLTMGTVNVVARHDLEAVTALGNTTPVTLEFTNPTTSLVASGNVVVTGNVTADHFVGDGSNITGISSTLQAITDSGPGANVTSNTVQFTNATTSLVASGTIKAGNDTNTTSYLGRAAVGYCGHNDAMAICHIDSNNTGGYALLQEANGETMLNSVSGQSVHIRQGNVNKLVINSSGYLKYNNQPRFSAYSNSSDYAYGAFSGGPVKLTSTFYNVGSHYSTSTGAFTAPITGHYRFSMTPFNNGSSRQVSMWYRTSNSGAWDDIGPYKLLGGSANGDETIFSTSGSEGNSWTIDLYVPVNYQIGFGGRGGGSLTIYRAHSYFSGELISIA